MTDYNVVKLAQPGTFSDSLTKILRNGAQALHAQAVEAEVADWPSRHESLTTDDGRRWLVRHGRLPEREIMTGIGAVAERLTGALPDRLTHHVHILEMNGDSYRLKQSRKRRLARTAQ